MFLRLQEIYFLLESGCHQILGDVNSDSFFPFKSINECVSVRHFRLTDREMYVCVRVFQYVGPLASMILCFSSVSVCVSKRGSTCLCLSFCV